MRGAVGVTYRRARIEDAERTFAVVKEAADDLLIRNGRQPTAGAGLPAARVIKVRHTCVQHDPDRFWVAEADGGIIGAGFAILRDDAWYLCGLHVVPAWQGRGIGAELVRRTLTGVGPETVRSVLTDALNPDSNGLYLRFGMLPQDSTLTFDGPLVPATGLGGMATRAIDPAVDQPALDALDRATVGFARPMDHTTWLDVPGLVGRMLLGGDTVRGYLYASERGAIGPVAAYDPADVAAALDAAADVARGMGATTLHLRAFGSGHAAITWAGAAGLRLTGIGMLLGSAPIGAFAGYVTSGADALY